jgi:hypothetical protein
MAQNRTHNSESQEHRLKRLKSHPVEAIETLLNSIANYFNNEIGIAPAHYQTSLMFLGIHASARIDQFYLFYKWGQHRKILL